ncbi:MAG: hypothetical protein ACI8X5_003883 [Planctomycetota bacterium]|jgi:hypothetical protein
MFDKKAAMTQRDHSHSVLAGALKFTAISLVIIGSLPATSQGQGTIDAWGWDAFGQVSSAPIGADLTQVARGHGHSLALRSGGFIVSWGLNSFGQVSNTPVGSGFVQVAGGGSHSLARRSDGSLVSWGSNGGLGGGQVSDTPNGTGFTSIASGGGHSLALRADGSIVSWGEDQFGQVSATPGATGFIQVAAGRDHSLALLADGSIVAWGYDTFGQVSNAPGGTGFTHLAGGADFSLAVRADGSIAAWGFDSDGQVSNTPVGTGFAQVSAAQYHSLALRTDGSLASWGYDVDGQVSNTPGGAGYTQLAVGSGRHCLALHVNMGAGFCFGDGSGTLCPCLLHGDPGEGCANTTGLGGARLSAQGNAEIANDTFKLLVNGLPSGRAGLCIKGTVLFGGGNGQPLGDGLLCLAPQIRSQVIVSDASGSVSMDDWRGQAFGTYPSAANLGLPTSYQWWYRDSTNPCSGSGFNLSNGWMVIWTP